MDIYKAVLIFVLLVIKPTNAIKWLALSRGSNVGENLEGVTTLDHHGSKFHSSNVCENLKGSLIRKQIKFCKRNPTFMDSVRVGAVQAIGECQYQFRLRRWNCSTVDFSIQNNFERLKAYVDEPQSGDESHGKKIYSRKVDSKTGRRRNTDLMQTYNFPYISENRQAERSRTSRQNDVSFSNNYQSGNRLVRLRKSGGRSRYETRYAVKEKVPKQVRRGKRLSRRVRHGSNGERYADDDTTEGGNSKYRENSDILKNSGGKESKENEEEVSNDTKDVGERHMENNDKEPRNNNIKQYETNVENINAKKRKKTTKDERRKLVYHIDGDMHSADKPKPWTVKNSRQKENDVQLKKINKIVASDDATSTFLSAMSDNTRRRPGWKKERKFTDFMSRQRNKWQKKFKKSENAWEYPVVSPGTREMAFVHAISSAGVAHALTRACSTGDMENCGCDRSLKGMSPEGFQWSGCSDNIDFGITFSKSFVDARDRRKSRKQPRKAQPLMNLHNNEAGRKLLEENMKIECKCHGVSGSCELKTCWRSVANFRKIGKALMEKFDTAHEVTQKRRRGRRMLIAIYRKFKQHTDTDLVYLKPSPSYCEYNVKQGSHGTHGRECKPLSSGIDGCDQLCCGRGFQSRREKRKERCECKFHWCCYVECKVCFREVEVSTCN